MAGSWGRSSICFAIHRATPSALRGASATWSIWDSPPYPWCSAPTRITSEQILVRDNKLFQKDKGTHGLSHVLRNGLVTSEGDFGRRQRRLAQPAFHRDRVAAYGEIRVAHTERAVAPLKPGATTNLHAALMHLTMKIVGKTLFDADLLDSAHEVGRAMEVVTKRFEAIRPGFSCVH